MDGPCLRAFQAGARALLAEVVPFVPAAELRELEQWVEIDLAQAIDGGEPPPPPSKWRGALVSVN